MPGRAPDVRAPWRRNDPGSPDERGSATWGRFLSWANTPGSAVTALGFLLSIGGVLAMALEGLPSGEGLDVALGGLAVVWLGRWVERYL